MLHVVDVLGGAVVEVVAEGEGVFGFFLGTRVEFDFVFFLKFYFLLSFLDKTFFNLLFNIQLYRLLLSPSSILQHQLPLLLHLIPPLIQLHLRILLPLPPLLLHRRQYLLLHQPLPLQLPPFPMRLLHIHLLALQRIEHRLLTLPQLLHIILHPHHPLLHLLPIPLIHRIPVNNRLLQIHQR